MDNNTHMFKLDNCLKHGMEKMELFCTDCQQPVCRECLVISHQRHTFSKLEVQIDKAETEFPQLTECVKGEILPDLEKKLENAASQKEMYSKEVDRVLEEFKNEAETLKMEIDNFILETERNIRSVQEKDEGKLDDVINNLEGVILKARTAIESKTSVDPKSSIEILRHNEEMTKIVQGHDIYVPVIKPPVKIPGKHNVDDLSRMIGKLDAGRTITQNGVLYQQFVLFTRYSITGLRCISEFRNNFVWVTNPSSANILDYIKISETKICIEKSLKLDENLVVMGMSFTSSQDLYFSTFKSSVLRVLKKGKSRLSEFVKLQNLQPYGMCVTQTNQLLVCVLESESNSQSNCFNRKAKLIRLSVTGKLLGDIECFEGKRIFVFPRYVAENKNGDICVSDWTSKKEGRVVVVDQFGNFKFNYCGPKGTPCLKPFALVCDSDCRIIVADNRNDAIHVIDKDGTFLQYVVTKENQVSEPCSVSISPKGDLWFGCLNSKFCVVRYIDNGKDSKESDEFSLI